MLYSAIDSVTSLMREVELKEKEAEQANVEAAMGGSDILVKTEEIKQMVKLAEETNSMVVFLLLMSSHSSKIIYSTFFFFSRGL